MVWQEVWEMLGLDEEEVKVQNELDLLKELLNEHFGHSGWHIEYVPPDDLDDVFEDVVE